ncbi:MAG TPA: hypothetical protein VGP08_03155 [Pyrinomonadaceae bacterium]|jgi:hypothetical protein|nr:hypothetical protein [Pyrinomonadaceae bacterium]
MRFGRRAVFKALAVTAIILAPAAEGALGPARFWPAYACACVVAIGAFAFDSRRAKRVTLVLASAALALTAADLALRLTSVVPDDLAARWPSMPLVNRYRPGLSYEGSRFNDLSRMAGVKEWGEEKRVRIVTDAYGFRNERADFSRPLDVIVLGDSFGAGAVSQEHTWSSILARAYGLNAYDLSAPGSGPWQEYVNLRAECGRLKVDADTVVVWQLFTGNDLDDEYGPLDMSLLPRRGAARAWLGRVNSWRARSPVRYLIENLLRGRDPRSDVIACDFLNGRKLLFYRPYTETSFRTPEQVSAHANFARLRETVGAMKNLAGSCGARLAVVLVPSKEEVYSWVWRGTPVWSSDAGSSGFSDMVARACGEEGIKFLDLKPELVAASRRAYEDSGRLLYWYDDTHMNVEGNVLAAAAIQRELLR